MNLQQFLASLNPVNAPLTAASAYSTTARKRDNQRRYELTARDYYNRHLASTGAATPPPRPRMRDLFLNPRNWMQNRSAYNQHNADAVNYFKNLNDQAASQFANPNRQRASRQPTAPQSDFQSFIANELARRQKYMETPRILELPSEQQYNELKKLVPKGTFSDFWSRRLREPR